MLHNKILFDIYKSVKNLDKNRMDKNTKKINNIIRKYHNQHGGIKESDEDYNNIMGNLDLIQTGFLDYFKSLQKYIEIYEKNAGEFEKLLNERLSVESLKKLSDSMYELNGILDKLK
jgi:hypothetical protein